jgi:hypothetical protein
MPPVLKEAGVSGVSAPVAELIVNHHVAPAPDWLT